MVKLALFTIILSSWLPTAAQSKNLFKYKKGKIELNLAKSVTRIDDTSYKVELDLNKKIRKKPLTAQFVKDSLEAKLSKHFALAVEIKNPNTLILKYQGDEKKFLKKLSRTRIKTKKRVALAMENTVTGSGIRAKEGRMDVGDDELRVRILKLTDTGTKALVLETGKNHQTNFNQGRTAQFVGTVTGAEPGKVMVIKPIRKDDAGWMMTAKSQTE